MASTVIYGYDGQQVQINLPRVTVLLKSGRQRNIMATRRDNGPIAVQPGMSSDATEPHSRWWQRWWRSACNATGSGRATLSIQRTGSTSTNGGGMVVTGNLNGFDASKHDRWLRTIAEDVVVVVPRGISVKVLAGTVTNPEGITLT